MVGTDPNVRAKWWERKRVGHTWKNPKLVPNIAEYIQSASHDTSNFVRRGSRNRKRPTRLGDGSDGVRPDSETVMSLDSSLEQNHVVSCTDDSSMNSSETANVAVAEPSNANGGGKVKRRKRAKIDVTFEKSDSANDLSSPAELQATIDEEIPSDSPIDSVAHEDASTGTVDVASKQEGKPEPHGMPEVWAEGRQALCESVPYYRSYQSGAYVHDDIAYGVLLDKQCGRRDYMDDEIVIARAGGCLRKNKEGDMEATDDHRIDNAAIRSFISNQRRHVPVVLIVGSLNPNCPTKLPHRYCVLGHFQVTGVWCEKIQKRKCYKFRFEKIDLASKSWWSPKSSANPPLHREYGPIAPRRTCQSCQAVYSQMYQQGWMCLNDTCQAFFKIDGTEPEGNLAYTEAFLNERTEWPKQIKPPYELQTSVLSEDDNDPMVSYSRHAWKGFVCPRCGRCNSRIRWHEWKCATSDCGFVQHVRHTVISPKMAATPFDIPYNGQPPTQVVKEDWVTEKFTFLDNYRVQIYTLPGGSTITNFLANTYVNIQAGGPDEMFEKLQSVEMGLRRFPLASHGLTGEAVTQHFSVNFGMDYKYVVDVDSKSFQEAPQLITDAVNRLTWAGAYVVNDESFMNFNELLAIGYFEGQKISYHDDGESTLGPTIATLSLGGSAVMRIRMKGVYYHLPPRPKYNPSAPVLRGAKAYEERVALNLEHGTIEEEEWNKKVDEMYECHQKSRATNPPNLLTMTLRHGDIVVMHGAELQKYFEHSVIPEGRLRFALTCRHVKPELIAEDRRWKGEFVRQPYNGDEGDPPIEN
ncbi:hypothetical protein L228DRAFT_283021 [Xylona heveae TC161]|uniref:Alpha-ketoglutarate-dependent dioxygenase AlkB-like domain-containing protein n=1 Tax=Xylona heveae (strain CBS 132557 / TC161) TaxID=1328760 RepID=A0A165H429_XYLHT|nr:hypothetical protein L228DRAFT_283021 [Xylona heveae TC161]KZF22959.1 hypothetical protein L228DRAFT_283021 [Xylona heveae TC161]